MLDKDTFIDGLNKLLVSFPNWNLDIDNKRTLRVWYEKFRHMDAKRYMHMINAYIGYYDRYPTIAGLLKCDTLPRKSITQIKHEQALKEHGYL